MTPPAAEPAGGLFGGSAGGSVGASAAQPAGGGPVRQRLAWVDATRGFSVAAVVLFHVVLWTYTPRADVAPVGAAVWSQVNGVLGSVRMPVLLAVSGLVLSRQVREGLHRSTTVYRAVNAYYLYVVWLALYALFYLAVREATLPHRVDGVQGIVQLVRPETTLWYLLALAVYIPVLALLRAVPAWLVLGALALLSIGTQVLRDVGDLHGLALKVPELFVFFAIGVYGSGLLRALAGRASAATAVLTAVAAAGLTLAGRWAVTPWAEGALFVLRGTAFLAFGVVVIVIACRWRPVERVGSALGSRTILVYVLHPLLLALWLVAEPAIDPAVRAVLGHPAGALAYPLVMTAAIVGLCLLADALVRRLGWRSLLELPPRAARALGRSVDRPARVRVAPITGSAA